MSYNFTALYAKIQSQVATGTSLSPTSVIWGWVNGDRPPSKQYVSLSVLNVTPLHQLTEDYTLDNPTPSAGNEIILRTKEHFEVTVEIQAFSVTQNAEYPAAPVMLETLRSYLGRESTLDQFRSVKATIINRGTIRHLPTVLNTMFESRAVLEVTFRAASGSDETTTYIETVDYTTTITS